MSLDDDITRFGARAAANAPLLAQNPNSLFMNVARAFLSAKGDTDLLITSTTPNLSVATADWDGLHVLADNNGVDVDTGTPSAGSVTFSILGGVASSTVLIQPGTVVATPGDNITVIPQYYSTTELATIASGGTTSNAVSVTAQEAGTAGNVAAHAIAAIITPGLSSTYSVDNAAPTTGGLDGDTETTLRAKIYAAIRPKYGASAIEAAALASSPSVYDVYLYDPADGTATLVLYNADSAGAVLSGATLAMLQAAVLRVLPAGVKTSAVTWPAFTTLNNVSALTLHYAAPSAIQATYIEPLIKTAAKAYFQGDSTIDYAGLKHGQAPTAFGLFSYVQQAVGGVLTYLTVTSSTPAFPTPAPAGTYPLTTLWRLNGTAATVVTVVRDT